MGMIIYHDDLCQSQWSNQGTIDFADEHQFGPI